MEINRSKLTNYIQNNGFSDKGGIVYQFKDSLIEVSLKNETKELAELVSRSEIQVVSKEKMMDTCFQELAEWSNENDILIMVNDVILICIPIVDKKYLS